MMLITSLVLCASMMAGPASEQAGPVLGDLTSTSVRVWFRPTEAGPSLLRFIPVQGGDTVTVDAQAQAAADLAVTVHVTGLKPDTLYHYSINNDASPDRRFRTPPVHDTTTRLAFGSCAKEATGSGRVWQRIDDLNVDGLVLLGDTPYIDTTDLTRQRERYRAFAQFPPFAALAAHAPVYSTWDDHDFGLNDTDGRLPGKENSRQAFTEYRPNPTFGEQDQGIFTSFRTGPVEVFLLDTRWFARTEGEAPNWSLLGKLQWQWLERELPKSTAPFKVLACGMVFNNSVRPGKSDSWGSYASEYDRLRALIDDIPGVVLVSGDVHWSRVLSHDETGDWPIMEFVTSPVHEHLIPAADPPHPWLRWSRGEINSFLLLDADEQEIRLSHMNAAGEVLHQQRLELPIVDNSGTPKNP